MDEKVMNNENVNEVAEAAVKAVEAAPKHNWKVAGCWGVGTLLVAGTIAAGCWLYKKRKGGKAGKQAKVDNMEVVKNDFEEKSEEEVEKK